MMDNFTRRSRKKTAIITGGITTLLLVYFLSTSIFFPQFYLSLVQQYPKPEISSVKISNHSIYLGQSFEITVIGTNNGVASDMQTLSMSFPNMTDTTGISIKDDNFTQHPLIIGKGQEVGSHYEGTQYPTYSQYPIVESYNRPWESGASHAITVDITPESTGTFLVLVKSVSIPHSNTIHYPSSGIQDQQSEYAVPYFINVTKH